MTTPFIELDTPLNDYAMLCRGCLAESGEMKDMQEWGLADDFYRIAEVQREHGISELLCTSCEDNLVKFKSFRKQCKKSDVFLKDTAKVSLLKKSAQINSNKDRIECVMSDHKLTLIITASDMEAKMLLPCPYASKKNCQEKYQRKHHLLTHLMKCHGVKGSFEIHYKFFCSYNDCYYFVDNKDLYFTERKFLNQHYNKVHKSKPFTCEVCSDAFSKKCDFDRHLKTCNIKFSCQICDSKYKSNDRLLVHLLRKHPEAHEEYKKGRGKRKSETVIDCKKPKMDEKLDYICDSPKRSFATQTLRPEENIKNDVTLIPWKDAKTDEISTQTVFEDLLSLKSQNSEDESIFSLETVSLSDIQTQTFPIEFGLSRSNKETITSETQSPDLSIKETQTCFCLYDSPKLNFKLFDSVSSSPLSINLTSTETQTGDVASGVKSDDLSVNSTETQTCFDEELGKESL